ncbi:MAG: hypothetical protein LW875_08855 [Proteobacteria bacterium]|nr:hypothetical protein [Pseudomonadota bacterium]
MILALFSVALSFQSQAYVGSVSAGTANSGLASVEASDTPFMNPAAVAHLSGYYFSTGYASLPSGDRQFSLSLSDNMKQTVIPTSLSYVQTSQDDINGVKNSSQAFRLSFGNFISSSVAFGLGVNHQQDRFLSKSYNQTNLGLATMWTPTSTIGFALFANNLLAPSKSNPEEIQQKGETILGASYNYRRFLRAKVDLATDSKNTMSKPALAAGIEYYMNRWVVARLGAAQVNETKSNLYAAGFGFVLPRFGLHYAYQNSPQIEESTRHSVDLAIPIW